MEVITLFENGFFFINFYIFDTNLLMNRRKFSSNSENMLRFSEILFACMTGKMCTLYFDNVLKR